MRTRKPYDRNDVRIKKGDYVLEVGPGHNPTFQSNVIAEKFIDTNYHRCGDVKIYPHQCFINADGENLPFKDKEFDYIICNQVLEHADNPEIFLREQFRVARRGYIETPSLLGEFLFPKASHKWVILDIDNKLVLFEKEKMPGNYFNNYGELFLNYLAFQSLPYKLLGFTEGDMMLNRYEWEGEIDFIINPTDNYYRSFFTQAWDRKMVEKLFPPRSTISELRKTIKGLVYLIKLKVKQKMNKRQPILLSEYMKQKEAQIEKSKSLC